MLGDLYLHQKKQNSLIYNEVFKLSLSKFTSVLKCICTIKNSYLQKSRKILQKLLFCFNNVCKYCFDFRFSFVLFLAQ